MNEGNHDVLDYLKEVQLQVRLPQDSLYQQKNMKRLLELMKSIEKFLLIYLMGGPSLVRERTLELKE